MRELLMSLGKCLSVTQEGFSMLELLLIMSNLKYRIIKYLLFTKININHSKLLRRHHEGTGQMNSIVKEICLIRIQINLDT